jgi:LPXTG-motif cell wall-anchored protein
VAVDSLTRDPNPANNAAEALTEVRRPPGQALPATGNRGISAPVTIAAVLLLVGTGMFGVARWRRRSVG